MRLLITLHLTVMVVYSAEDYSKILAVKSRNLEWISMEWKLLKFFTRLRILPKPRGPARMTPDYAGKKFKNPKYSVS
jgi:hypothetical protein